MKNVLRKIAFIAIVIIASGYSSEATNIVFKINITDGCFPSGYNGNYVATITITFNNGPVLCTKTTTCTLTTGINQMNYTCSIPDQGADCKYEFNVRVCRCTNPLSCCANNVPTDFCYDNLSDNSQQVDVPL